MAGERTSFLLESEAIDDFDIELLDGGFEAEHGVGRRGGFGQILRLATAATLACSVAWVSWSLARPALQAKTSRPPFLSTVELDALPEPATVQSLLRMHDGNPCDAHEELYGGLCYKRCRLLTQDEAPIRTSSWTCCENHPCSFSNQRGNVGHSLLCTGFDVNGQGGCPHKPGACLQDEELHLGVCYKKCSLLTLGKFPYRSAAATCCKTQGLGCLDIFNDRTRNSFNVGGEDGDHDPSTLAKAHPPAVSWTETGDMQVTTTIAVSSPSPAVENVHVEPVEHLHDGNVCDDEEELYGGLCYKKCGVLTGGEAPIRTSSWTCCQSHPCGLWNQKGSLGHSIICNGFDVAADGACPHKPGTCLVNEEKVLGVCYEKCSILTKGAFPYRLTAATCCKDRGLGCLNPWNDRTSDSFDAGGGRGPSAGDSHAHLPDEALTEAKDGDPSPQQIGGRHPHEAPRQQKVRHQVVPVQGSAFVSADSQLEDLLGGEGGLPLGSAVPAQGANKSQAALEVQQALEAQAAVQAIIKAMK